MKVIKNFDDYMISESGKVYDTIKKRYLSPTPVAGGLQYRLRTGQKRISGEPMFSARYGHRLVADAFLGIKKTDTIGFKDGRKENIKLSNLYIKKYYLSEKEKKEQREKTPKEPKRVVNYECDTSWMGSGYQI